MPTRYTSPGGSEIEDLGLKPRKTAMLDTTAVGKSLKVQQCVWATTQKKNRMDSSGMMKLSTQSTRSIAKRHESGRAGKVHHRETKRNPTTTPHQIISPILSQLVRRQFRASLLPGAWRACPVRSCGALPARWRRPCAWATRVRRGGGPQRPAC